MKKLFASAVLATCLASPIFAADVVVDLVNSDPADPGGGWNVFNAAQGTPGKPFNFRFVSADSSALPLSASGTCGTSGACIVLTAGETAPFSTPKECSELPGGLLEPEFNAANAGQCFYRLSSSGGATEVIVFNLAMLEAGADIRVEIGGLTPALPFHSFVDFDTSAAPNGAPQPEAARPPANLALVFDKSGSMAWSNSPMLPGCEVTAAPPPGCEPSRWEVLNRAAQQMAVVAKAYVLPIDEVGAVAFDSNATVIQNMIGANATTIQNIVDDLNGSFSPGGGTSVGDGVDTFDDIIAAEVGETNTMLLFSDGIQNSPVFLRLVGNQLRINPDSNSDIGPNVRDVPANVNLCIFALRAEGTADPLDLQGISDQRCDGLMVETASTDPIDSDLVAFFLQVLNDTLIGDKLELISSLQHQVFQNVDNEEFFHEFTIGEDSISLTTLIAWRLTGNGLRELTLEKDGVRFNALARGAVHRLDRGRDHLAVTLRETGACGRDVTGNRACLNSLGGTWRLTARPFFEMSRVFNAKTTIISDNATIASTFDVSEVAPGLGQPIRITANLMEAGQPIDGLPLGSVRAIVRSPGGNRGDFLARLNIDIGVGSPDIDPLSPAALKALTALSLPAEGDALRKILVPGQGISIDLSETAPGVYQTEVPANFEGTYQVRFEIDAPASRLNGPFERLFVTSIVKSVALDEARTLASITTAPANVCPSALNCLAVTITPQDASGVLVGPAFSSAIAVSGNATQVGAIVDRLDGTYQLTVGCPRNAECAPVISVRNAGVKPVLTPPQDPGKGFAWDVKMICGLIKDERGILGNGRYHTVINVLATEKDARIKLRYGSAIPAEKRAHLGERKLRAGQTIAIDCRALLKRLRAQRALFTEGMLTIESSGPLAVSAVYTASGLELRGMTPSLEVQRIPPRTASR